MYVYFNETQGDIFSYDYDPYTGENDIILLAYHLKNYPLKNYNANIMWNIYEVSYETNLYNFI